MAYSVELAQKLILMSLKVQNILENSRHPDGKAAIWAMMNFSNALRFGAFSATVYNLRIEGNALTAMCFRNGSIEALHSGKKFSDEEIKALNVWSSRALTGALVLKDICTSLGPEGEEFWQHCIVAYHKTYCSDWETKHKPPIDDSK